MALTTDPNDPRLSHGSDTEPRPQNEVGCSKCQSIKAHTEFSTSSRNGVKRFNSWCKRCSSEHMKAKYQSLTSEQVRAKVARNEERRQENMRRIYNYLESHPCVDCDEDDPIVLEFDHVRGEKRGQISDLASTSWKAVVLELEKCEVRCANCHARRTHTQLGYRDYGVAPTKELQ